MRNVLLALGLALFAGLVAAAVHYERDLGQARARLAQGQFAQTPCGRIGYGVAGTGADLLLIHGAGGGFDQALGFGRRLLDAGGVRIIAPSRFGYAGTPVPADPSVEKQADAHACLLDALGIAQPVVLGASAGAPSAMQLCIRHPEHCRALVLLVPAAWTPERKGGTEAPQGLRFVFEHVLLSDPVLWAMEKTAPRRLVQTLFATPLADYDPAPPEEKARIQRALELILPVSERRQGLLVDAQVVSHLARFDLEKIRVPTLLITVRDDLYGTWENARYTASQIPGARFVSFANGGHLWIGHDREVMEEIRRFTLAAMAPPAPAKPAAPSALPKKKPRR